MTIEIKDLNQFIGVCQKCGKSVKEMYVSGWGIVPNSAQCIGCGRQAQTDKHGNTIIAMRANKEDQEKLLKKLEDAANSPSIEYEVIVDDLEFGHKVLKKKNND